MTTSQTHVEIRAGAYADSVTLLQVSRAVQGLDGVASAQVAMATPLNLEVLAEMGFDIPAEATPNDMLVAIKLADGAGSAELDAALAGVDRALAEATRRPEGGNTELEPPRTIASALARYGDDLVLISVPGPNAVVEAMDAIEAGTDVMIFSDNVPVEAEVALKRAAERKQVLVMGPDCGTAVVDGVGLGFANVVAPGPVGMVAASGTGAQQVMALLDAAGVGVRQVYGVGGRDLSAEVGGLATGEALRRLEADAEVERIVLVSKPPAADVAAAIDATAESLDTPVSKALLGPGQPDLTAATEQLLGELDVAVPEWPVAGTARAAVAGTAIAGLFCGGTLCTEARLIAEGAGAEGTFIDFGDDEYTSGRAHPMIDPTLRLEHVASSANDPAVGVLLLDVVLGHGADADPAASLAPAIENLTVPVVITVVGTSHDPQGLQRQIETLAAAGAEVYVSNAQATHRAIELAGAAR